MLHLPLLRWHQLGSVAKKLKVLMCKENASRSSFLAAQLMGCAGTVQMCHQVLVKLCWLQLAQEGLAVLSNLRLSSTSPGATGTRGFFWHRFVTSWITLVGDSLSHIPSHLSEGASHFV